MKESPLSEPEQDLLSLDELKQATLIKHPELADYAEIFDKGGVIDKYHSITDHRGRWRHYPQLTQMFGHYSFSNNKTLSFCYSYNFDDQRNQFLVTEVFNSEPFKSIFKPKETIRVF